ncbi:MAG: hypothetical protein HFJ33_05165 [Clostridia bacterium]|nr:hypothetical protein [Clostridia bacterium]
MFKRLELVIKNRLLQKENMELYEENKANREDIEDLELQTIHARLLAECTLSRLLELEQIDRSGIAGESKRQQRNVIFNELRKSNINMIKELSNKFGNVDNSKQKHI